MVTLNIIMIGDKDVGVYTFYKNIDEAHYYQYLTFSKSSFFEYSMKTIRLFSKEVEMRFFKLLPGSQFKISRQAYYESSHGAVILFDVTNRDSLTHVSYYLKEILQRRLLGPSFPFVVLGTKIDLRLQGPEFVTDQEAESFCSTLQSSYSDSAISIKFFPISTKTNENVDSFFTYIAEKTTVFTNSVIKILLLGERYVGITTFFKKYCKSRINEEFSFSEDRNVVEIAYKNILSNNIKIGAEFCRVRDHVFALKYFPDILPSYYQRTQVGMFVFDVTNRASFQKIDDLITDFLKYNGSDDIFIILLGSKIDLRDTVSEYITDNEAELYRSQLIHRISRDGLKVAYFPISIKTGTNIQSCFDSIVEYSSFPKKDKDFNY